MYKRQPLLVAFTATWFLRSKKRKLILNVSDLWPLAGLELGVFKKNMVYKMLEKLESFNYKQADLVLGQSKEILTHIKSKYPNKDIFLYRNFPNFEPPNIIKKGFELGKLTIVYAGLLGVAQGIYKLCQNLDFSHVQLHIYGAGAERQKIKEFIENNPNLDIVYHGEVSRKKLHLEITKYDVTIIPLLNRIYGSVPSKIFEYALLGMPMIYFGGGEGEKLIEKYNLGWVAQVGDYDDLNRSISKIPLNEHNINFRKEIQKRAIDNFDHEKQLSQLIKQI